VFDCSPADARVPVPGGAPLDTRDPYAVVAAFRTGPRRWVEWVYAATCSPMPDRRGRRRRRPDQAATTTLSLVIELNSPSATPPSSRLGELADFLDRTYDVVVPATSTSGQRDQALTHLISNDMS